AWTVAQLRKEFAADIRTVPYTLKKEKGTARCLPLMTLIQAAQPRLDPRRKNHLLAFAVIVRAEDGYAVCFSLGELLPEHGKRAVWLALDRNGKPLSAEEGPVRLLVPGEEKAARWVHGVTSLTLIDGAADLGRASP